MAYRIVQTGGTGQSANFENVNGGLANDFMTGNAASNVFYGNGGDDTLIGNAGDDILIGGAGNDVLKGISGRNILIGGIGSDVLQGGTGDDLLLTGSSTYESNPDALQALRAEWASGNSYSTRINHLLGTTGGGANGLFTLTSTSVKNDPDTDFVTGNAGQDWYLASSLQDVLNDKAGNRSRASEGDRPIFTGKRRFRVASLPWKMLVFRRENASVPDP